MLGCSGPRVGAEGSDFHGSGVGSPGAPCGPIGPGGLDRVPSLCMRLPAAPAETFRAG